MWGFWLIAAGFFFVLEIFTAGFLVFWLGIAAVVAMMVSFLTTNILIQTIVFVIVSILLIFFTRPLVNKFLKIDKIDTVPTNVYRLIGKEGVVLEDIDPLKYTGKVKALGEVWSAYSDKPIEKDKKVTVLSVDGVKLKVEEKEIKEKIEEK